MTWLGFAIAVLLLIVILQNFVAAQELHAIYLRIAAFAKKTEEDTKAMADTQADTTAQIQTTISQLMAKATINTDRLASIRDLLHGYRSEVQKFVARAVAASNPSNPDPAALQSALDNLNTLNSELDAQAAAEAVIMNTEAPDTTTQDPLSETVVPATPTTPVETPPAPLPDSTQQEMQAGSDALPPQPEVPPAQEPTPTPEATPVETPPVNDQVPPADAAPDTLPNPEPGTTPGNGIADQTPAP